MADIDVGLLSADPTPGQAQDVAIVRRGIAPYSIALVRMQSFETVNSNLAAADAAINYSGGNVSSVVYSNGITKTFAYGPDGLSSVTLSGSTPGGIDLVKTLNYTLGELTGFTYS